MVILHHNEQGQNVGDSFWIEPHWFWKIPEPPHEIRRGDPRIASHVHCLVHLVDVMQQCFVSNEIESETTVQK
jgi:hypothetical protein